MGSSADFFQILVTFPSVQRGPGSGQAENTLRAMRIIGTTPKSTSRVVLRSLPKLTQGVRPTRNVWLGNGRHPSPTASKVIGWSMFLKTNECRAEFRGWSGGPWLPLVRCTPQGPQKHGPAGGHQPYVCPAKLMSYENLAQYTTCTTSHS